MKLTKGIRSIAVAIMAVLALLLFVCLLAGVVLQQDSLAVARANPGLAHMRVPVLLLGLCLLALFAAALVLAEFALGRILRDRIFTRASAQLIRAMSWLFFCGLLPLVALFVYTAMNVSQSITQLYVLFGAVALATAGLVLRLLANLVAEASLYKQEVDLTV